MRHAAIPVPIAAATLLALFTPAPTLDAQQCPSGLGGAWTSSVPAEELLAVNIRIHELGGGRYEARLRSTNRDEIVPVWMDGDHMRLESAVFPLAFNGVVSNDSRAIAGFIYFGVNLVRVQLPRESGADGPAWSGTWYALGAATATPRLDLYIEDDGADGVGGYFFFRDQRLPSLWGEGVRCEGDRIVVREKNLALTLEGEFDRAQDRLIFTATTMAGSAPLAFTRMSTADTPAQEDAPERPPRLPGEGGDLGARPAAGPDGWPTAAPAEVGIDTALISGMVAAVARQDFSLIHSVLVARSGRLAVEEYFYGYDRDTWHDMRSASKSLTSTLVGLAIQEGFIANASATALPFFPQYRRYDNWDPRKADITVRDLLTMSSGLDANDSDSRSVASEEAYQSQVAQPDWVKLALDAPMVADPGTRVVYGGANPLILGGILAATVDEPVEWFADRTLFAPLGIDQYRFYVSPTGIVYMGGGLYLRPRDMLKYGQLYLGGGVWQGRRILAQEWIDESWGQYGRLEPLDRNGHQYGYLWWHHRYDINGQTIATVEARGNGGQYVFVVPSLDLVVVITAGNYRQGLQATRQPEEIMRQYILPAILGPQR
jgi:CubicO group peptidase (beta-lactamase class C family)